MLSCFGATFFFALIIALFKLRPIIVYEFTIAKFSQCFVRLASFDYSVIYPHAVADAPSEA
jgi:hypothetical protein